MFGENYWDNDDMSDGSIENLMLLFHKIKAGDHTRLLTEEEFEILIDFFYQEDDGISAIEACELAEQFYPYSSNIFILKAEILFHMQKFGQALLALDKYDQLEFQSIDSIILRSDILKAKEQYNEAIGLLKFKLDLFEGKDRINLLLELSEIYDEIEDYKKVFYVLEEILFLDYKNEDALHKISFWTSFLELYDESIKIHQYIVNEDPYNSIAWFNLGTAFQGKRQYLEAIDAYEFCLVIDDKFEFAYRNIADAYIRLKQYKKAINSLKKHIDLGVEEDVVFEALGLCYEKLGNFESARQYYLLASHLDPEDENLYYKIGSLYAKEGKWDAALKHYERALVINNKHLKSLQGVGIALLEMEDFETGFAFLKKATSIKVKNITPWILYLKRLIQLELYETAQEAIEEAFYYLGENIDLMYLNAVIHFGLGNTKEAMLLLENALSLDAKKSKSIFALMPELSKRNSVINLIGKYKKH